MNIISVLFLIFSGLLCASALQVILVKNPVHSALFLILTFVSASALFILQGAEFLGLILILVYVGAVMVLFLFVVMMLDVKAMEHLKQNIMQYIPTVLLISTLLFAQIAYILYKSNFNYNNGYQILTTSNSNSNTNTNTNTNNNTINTISNTHALGKLLFTNYIFAFEVAGSILLVGIIIAVVLTLRSRKDAKSLDVSEQVKVKAKDRIILVDSKINAK
jgi:NADH-quinone oxidoreductase subunit J